MTVSISFMDKSINFPKFLRSWQGRLIAESVNVDNTLLEMLANNDHYDSLLNGPQNVIPGHGFFSLNTSDLPLDIPDALTPDNDRKLAGNGRGVDFLRRLQQ
ncbi:hypothetical protein CVT25_014668 [Psilocybe cyanescens]|uniref:Uncharacterized protein n=1 Tax=Psilocybe cyanescens TaxID=93625 RepID=A0A409WU72_PSICY|nr:hypothetical protein CVT25_014668 [Psilocybe cyanescens]